MNELSVRERRKHLRHLIVRHQTERCRKGVDDRRRWRFDVDLPSRRPSRARNSPISTSTWVPPEYATGWRQTMVQLGQYPDRRRAQGDASRPLAGSGQDTPPVLEAYLTCPLCRHADGFTARARRGLLSVTFISSSARSSCAAKTCCCKSPTFISSRAFSALRRD